MAATKERNTLYVKLKSNSPFTVNREAVDSMAEHFDQDTTFVTHFALARLRDDIQAGRLDTATAVPVLAQAWLTPAETDQVREAVERSGLTKNVVWQEKSPEFAGLLEKM